MNENICEFYPKEKDDPVCACNSDISGKFICTKEYSNSCQWANERRKQEREIKMKEGKKESKDKLNWAVVPMESMNGVVRVFEKGFVKYHGSRTWLPGIMFSKLFSAAMRHLGDWFYLNKDRDNESGEHPLCHVIANCLMILTFIENRKYDDRMLRNIEKDK